MELGLIVYTNKLNDFWIILIFINAFIITCYELNKVHPTIMKFHEVKL